jgi:plasmid stabilization system protein ParE
LVALLACFCFNQRNWAAKIARSLIKGKRMRYVWWLLVFAVAAMVAPAQARPRDDALAGAFRCAAIADSRIWLDCYYGAAQPVRAALGLSPALSTQLKLAASPPAGGQPRDESVRDEVMSGATGCIRIVSDRPWLDCYYAAASPMRVQLGLLAPQAAPKLPSAPQLAYVPPAARTVPAGPPPMPRNTGLFNGVFNEVKPVVQNVPMKSFTMDRSGAFTATLADGQVWTQIAEDEIYHPARFREAGPNALVTISPSAMHTFLMKVSGSDRAYKVRRIR